LLAQSVVARFGGQARFVSENYGDSDLARRFGVTRYPAIFVDDILVATPKDFGFYGKGEGAEGGRYAPLRSSEAHERFRSDLARMVELVLAGRKGDARARARPSGEGGLPPLPAGPFAGVDGKTVSRESLAGKVVVVELWATWCPPCRSTLAWLGEIRKRFGTRVEVVAVAVESDEGDVRRIAGEMRVPVDWVMGTPDLVRALGDVSAVPTLLVFDGTGKNVGAFYGAPPGLHADVEARLDAVVAR
jgi:thiol-disulfide isomerase/thioredoxin